MVLNEILPVTCISPFYNILEFTIALGFKEQVAQGILFTRGAESWWGCSNSDSGSDSGLLIESDSGSGSDTKYKINNTFIVERVSAVQGKT